MFFFFCGVCDAAALPDVFQGSCSFRKIGLFNVTENKIYDQFNKLTETCK